MNIFSSLGYCIFLVLIHMFFLSWFSVKDKLIATSITQRLKKCGNMVHEEWDLHLQNVVYQINTTLHVGLFSIWVQFEVVI